MPASICVSRASSKVRLTAARFPCGQEKLDSLLTRDSLLTLGSDPGSPPIGGSGMLPRIGPRCDGREPRQTGPVAVLSSPLMPRLIHQPAVIQAAGNKPKRIEEYAVRVNSGHSGVSVA